MRYAVSLAVTNQIFDKCLGSKHENQRRRRIPTHLVNADNGAGRKLMSVNMPLLEQCFEVLKDFTDQTLLFQRLSFI